MILRFLIILVCISLCSCKVTKNWKGQQNNNSISASYDSFNGKEKIKIPKSPDSIVYLSYLVKNNDGRISLNVNRENFNFWTDSIKHLKYDLNSSLVIKITGKNADGKLHLDYPSYKKQEIVVDYNENFELLCLAYFLSNQYQDIKISNMKFDYEGQEIRIQDLFALNIKTANYFKNHIDSENLKILNEYFEKHWYLDYGKFVMTLQNFPNAKKLELGSGLNSLFISKDDENKFITALNDFYKEISFDQFLKNYHPYYERMIQEVKSNLPKENFISEMEHLYGKKAKGYFMNASLTMPFSQGFGVSINDSIGYVFGAVAKPGKLDIRDSLELGFDDTSKLRNISIHEFGHTFVNPAVDQVDDSILQKKEYLYLPIKEEMSSQQYTTWKISLYEHFVRAGEIFIAELLGDEKTVKELNKEYIQHRKFIYLKQILSDMKRWYYMEYFHTTYNQFVENTISNLQKE